MKNAAGLRHRGRYGSRRLVGLLLAVHGDKPIGIEDLGKWRVVSCFEHC